MSVKRVFVEKKPEFAVQARELCDEIESYLGIAGVTGCPCPGPLRHRKSVGGCVPGGSGYDLFRAAGGRGV